MHATLILAEAATVHPDGTFSLIRGGLNEIKASGFPAPFRGSLVVRVVAEPSEAGPHDFRIVLMNNDGREVMRIEGRFETQSQVRFVHFCVQLGVMLPAPDRYGLRLTIDRLEVADWDLGAVLVSQPTPPMPPA